MEGFSEQLLKNHFTLHQSYMIKVLFGWGYYILHLRALRLENPPQPNRTIPIDILTLKIGRLYAYLLFGALFLFFLGLLLVSMRCASLAHMNPPLGFFYIITLM
jgi:hypothetical protein